jgi:hypothetical protein
VTPAGPMPMKLTQRLHILKYWCIKWKTSMLPLCSTKLDHTFTQPLGHNKM